MKYQKLKERILELETKLSIKSEELLIFKRRENCVNELLPQIEVLSAENEQLEQNKRQIIKSARVLRTRLKEANDYISILRDNIQAMNVNFHQQEMHIADLQLENNKMSGELEAYRKILGKIKNTEEGI